MECRLFATTVRHMDHAHERQSTGRSWHGRFTPGPEAQLARANSPAVPSLLRLGQHGTIILSSRKQPLHDLFQKVFWACKQQRTEGFSMIYSNVEHWAVNPLR